MNLTLSSNLLAQERTLPLSAATPKFWQASKTKLSMPKHKESQSSTPITLETTSSSYWMQTARLVSKSWSKAHSTLTVLCAMTSIWLRTPSQAEVPRHVLFTISSLSRKSRPTSKLERFVSSTVFHWLILLLAVSKAPWSAKWIASNITTTSLAKANSAARCSLSPILDPTRVIASQASVWN